MKLLVLALATLAAVSAHAQTDGVMSLAPTSDPFTIELPDSFVYMGVHEETPNRRVYHLRENTAESAQRSVIIITETGLSARERQAFADGSSVERWRTPYDYTRVVMSNLTLFDGLRGSAKSAFTVGESGSGSRVGFLVRGCAPDLCYQLSAAGEGELRRDVLTYASLLSGFRVEG